MNQIAIGDSSAGWVVLAGQSVSVPFFRCAYQPVFSTTSKTNESIEIQIKGTPSEITTGLGSLEAIIQRASLYDRAGYPVAQYLRFQPSAGGDYYYAPLSDLHLETHPDGYVTHQVGSLVVTLHFTRPNHFDSDEIELPLTTKSVTDQTGGVALINHSDYHTGHTNSVLVKPADVGGALPAPLRVELTNTYATDYLKDIYIGSFHHLTVNDEDIFHLHATDYEGGTLYSNAGAINIYYARDTITTTSWEGIGYWLLSSDRVLDLSGRFFRPVLHFYNAHAYSDLQLKIFFRRGSDVLCEYEPVWSDPDYKYVIFPPVQIPPNQLLLESDPHHIEVFLYGQHNTSGTYTIDIDHLTLLPLDYSAFFLGFYNMLQNAVLIDDNFRNLYLTQFDPTGPGYESVSHLRQGEGLLICPNEYNRIFFLMANSADNIDIFRTASVRLYYRKRVRFL